MGYSAGIWRKKTLPILAEGSEAIKKYADEYEKAGLVIDQESADMAQNVEIQTGKIGDTLRGLGNTIAITVLPLISDGLDKIVPIIQDVIGKVVILMRELPGLINENLPAITKVVNAFREGEWTEAW